MAFIQLLLLLGLFAAYGDAGAGIDPNGGARAHADEGPAICPSGLRARADDGNGFDPHGSPRTTGDEGSGIDPHGGRTTTDGRGVWDPNG